MLGGRLLSATLFLSREGRKDMVDQWNLLDHVAVKFRAKESLLAQITHNPYLLPCIAGVVFGCVNVFAVSTAMLNEFDLERVKGDG